MAERFFFGAKRMFMEQKKLLWIIAAVGIFLCVVFAGVLIGYNGSLFDKSENTVALQSSESAYNNNESGWSNPSDNTDLNTAITNPNEIKNEDGIQIVEVPNMVVYSENTTVQGMTDSNESISLDYLMNNKLSENGTVSSTNDAEQVKTVPLETVNSKLTDNSGSDYTVNLNAVEAERSEKVASVKRVEPNKTVSSNHSVTSSKKTNATVKTSPKKSEAKSSDSIKNSTPSSVSKPVTRYWVQVASYSNKKTAENARAILSESKITSDIFTYEDNKNNLFYRVRVGPYTTKSEAEYWMSKISQVKDFSKAGSYVTSTTN